MGNGAVHGSKSRIAGLYPDCTSERSELSKRIPDSGDSIQTIRQLCNKYGSRNAGCQIRCQHFRKKHGSRAFRSSIASNMVNDRISTEVVRKVLGHGTKHAIRHYARMDVENMRLCPLPAPKPSGIFSELLSWKEDDVHV